MNKVVILTDHINYIDPNDINSYIKVGGYQALTQALSMDSSQIIEEVKESKLRGRGGASFPTGTKMESVFQEKENIKYVICNADEGEPGNYKDKYLIKNNPHLLIEGLIIAGYAIKAQHGYIYIKGEYDTAQLILKNALDDARIKKFLGNNILGTNFSFDIEIRSGAGSYLCGEEYAQIASIEGQRGKPRIKPPFPTSQGLFNKPTLINNVETLCNLPFIIHYGGHEYCKYGTETSNGTMLVSLSGHVKNPGVYEVELGTSIDDIINTLGDGVKGNNPIKLIQLGGPSGPVIPSSMIDLKIDYQELRNQNLSIGSGALIVVDDRYSVFDILENNLSFFEYESCGHCTPCREGIRQLKYLINLFNENKATNHDLEQLKKLSDHIRRTAFCGLGSAAPTCVLSALKYFEEDFLKVVHNNGEVKHENNN